MPEQLPQELAGLVTRTETLALPFAVSLGARFAHLIKAFAEDYDGAIPSAASLRSLVGYLEANTSMPSPEITLTPTGDWVGEWFGPQSRRIAIEFMDTGTARILVVWPNSRHPDRIDRLVMTTTVDALAETLRPLSPYTELAA
jgi:hypothetical protein